jgi:ribosomal 30S subunit maturation factor RimM
MAGGAVAIDEAPDSTEFVEIGMIAETHGIHGELRVRSLTDFPVERFETVYSGFSSGEV